MEPVGYFHGRTQMLKRDYSPEQVSGRLFRFSHIRLSPESIYRYIWKDKKQGGTLYSHLRNSRKKRKKRYGSKDRRGQIRNRVSIDERPKIVDKRVRMGDWEIDTVIGKNHKGALVTIVERKSRYTLIKILPSRKSELVTGSVVNLMEPLSQKACTITADNSKEFAGHEDISKGLGIDFYFAHPYHSWKGVLMKIQTGLYASTFPKE